MKKIGLLTMAVLLTGASSFAQNRVTLVETFTSSTCPPCNPGNVALEALLSAPENDGKFVSVKYQMNWPGNGDPYYTAEMGSRKNIYSVQSVPNTQIDAGYDGGPSNLTQADLNNAYAVSPLVDLSAYYQVNEVTQTVDVQVDYEALADLPPSTRLFVAIFEYETSDNVGGNGETQFEHVVKKIYNGASGLHLGPQTTGDIGHEELTHTFNGNYVLPANAIVGHDESTEHTVEEFSDIGVAVWLQSNITKEIYQATYANVGFSPLAVEEIETFTSAKIYPNPTAGNAVIAFQLTQNQSEVSVNIVNSLGQVVYFDLIENVEAGRSVYDFNTDSLASGVYSINISSESGSISKRLIVE